MAEKNIYIIIPIFNEDESVVCDVINDVQQKSYQNIIIVDDGSDKSLTDMTIERYGVIYMQHGINRGKGVAIRTGLAAARKLGAEYVITMDGDGQHDPRDIDQMVKMLDAGVDVVLGTRDFTSKSIPVLKRLFNNIGNILTFMVCGLMVHDSQSGFRAYSQQALDHMKLKSNRYEYESEVIYEIYKNNLVYKEAPINVRYTKYSQEKLQKQGFINGIKTFFKMIFFK